MTEEQLAKSIVSNYLAKDSKIFRKFSHNLNLDREWNFYCGTDIDILEVTRDNKIIGYELKGYRKYKENFEPPGLYEGLDQALNYLNLPYVCGKDGKMLFEGGVFDFVYLVHAREKSEFLEYERRVFGLTPVGFIIATSNGNFHKVQEAKSNPIQSIKAQEHFLKNLDSLKKFSININEKANQNFSK